MGGSCAAENDVEAGSALDAAAVEARREGELVERARRGDLDAYDRLVRRHAPLAHRMAFTITRDAGDAEEAVQDAFVKAYRALPRFRRGAPFKPWLIKIVVNEAKTRLRSRRRHAAIPTAAIDEVAQPALAAGSAESTVLSRHQRSALLAAIDRLSDKLRDVVTCRYLLELSEEETAAALSIRPGTVKSRLSRALDRLGATLAADFAS